MAFKISSRLSDEEKFEKKLKRATNKKLKKQMLNDALEARKAQKKALVSLKSYKSKEIKSEDKKEEESPDLPVAAEAEKPHKPTFGERFADFFAMRFICAKINMQKLADKVKESRKIIVATLSALLVISLSVFAANYFICYNVILDGHSIGIVRNMSELNETLDSLQETLRKQYSLSTLEIERSITANKVLAFSREEVLSEEEIYSIAKEVDLPLYCEGAMITINGVDTVKLSSVAEAQEVVDKLYEHYLTSGIQGGEVLDVIEQGAQETLEITPKVIAIGSSSNVDEAVEYLTTLVENTRKKNEEAEAKQLEEEEKQLMAREANAELTKITITGDPSEDTEALLEESRQKENEAVTAAAHPIVDNALIEAANASEDFLIMEEGGSDVLATALVFRADMSDKGNLDESIPLNVSTKCEVRYTTEMPYEIIKEESSSYYIGEEVLVQAGSDGQSTIHSIVTYVNGVAEDERILEEKVIVETVNEVLATGTKPLPEAYATGRFMVPASGDITATDKSGSHAGFKAVDIANRVGAGVYASDSGTVVQTVSSSSGYGNYIEIAHSDGYSTFYAHLDYIGVSVGQQVSRGDFIGRMGSTGYSTGPHLHFELRLNGVREYLPAYFDCFYIGNYVHAFE